MNIEQLAYLDGAEPSYQNPANNLPELDPIPTRDDTRTSDAGLLARQCHAIMSSRACWDDSEREQVLRALCESQGVDFPSSRWGLGPSVLRLNDPKWWARKLHQRDRREWEAEKIRAGVVSRRGQLYCTDKAVQQWETQRRCNLEHLQSVFCFNDDGYVASLADMAAKSLANPECRRAEMIARIKGMADYAAETGQKCLFITITCPSRYHVSSGKYDRENAPDPRQAQAYLRKVWSRIRAKLDRDGVRYHFMRIAEPHNDGTPHWHIVLFCSEYQSFTVCKDVCRYAREADAQELKSKKAKQARCFIKAINAGADSVVGYVIKYVSKNIDGRKANGESMGETLDRNQLPVGDAVDTAKRVLAWASLWGIRQFQQGGAPTVGPYRELRRIHYIITSSETMEAARLAADSGDFCAYMKAVEQQQLATIKQCDALDYLKAGDDRKAAEALNDYEEPVFRVKGVTDGKAEIITRTTEWLCMTSEAIDRAWLAADTADIKTLFDGVRAEVRRIEADFSARREAERKRAAQPAALDLCQ